MVLLTNLKGAIIVRHITTKKKRGVEMRTRARPIVDAGRGKPSAVELSRRKVLLAGAGIGAALMGFAARSSSASLTAISRALPDTRGKGVLLWDVAGLDYVAEEFGNDFELRHSMWLLDIPAQDSA